MRYLQKKTVRREKEKEREAKRDASHFYESSSRILKEGMISLGIEDEAKKEKGRR